MKKLCFILLVVLIGFNQAFSQSNVATIDTSKNSRASLDFLKDLNGKSCLKYLLDNLAFKKRLMHLIGNRYKSLKIIAAVESPVMVNNNIVIIEGCQAHNCNMTNVIVVIDLSKNIMYAGIKKEGQIKTYSEDGSSSSEIADWAKKI
jgi:hypothetical protein